MSVARHHADWLNLVEISGPFLSMPVLMRVFPQGLDQLDPGKAKDLRLAYDEWLLNPEAPGRQRAWVDFVVKPLLGCPPELVADGQGISPGLQATMAEYGETLRPDLAIVAPTSEANAGVARLLLQVYSPQQDLEAPVAGKHWKASPATRMTELLHASGVLLGLVTNGEQWMLVFAPRGETTGYASWYAGLWQDEPITLRAFRSLLHVRRFFGVAEGDTLEALLEESARDQQEVTDRLGFQVRRAVEVLVQAFDNLDEDSGRALLVGVDEKMLYEAALTVMMRLVFLFCAEERRIFFPLANDIYDQCYAASTLREQLREIADQFGEEVLERRHDAWARLLGTFRAIHSGVEHENMRLLAYGGTLFDPDRYPFLEGRRPGTRWRKTPANPLAINNRVVLHLLESLQVLQVKVPGGGPAEARRLSFRGLDIEQIGHVYEGLLAHAAVRATTTVLGLHGTKDMEPEIPLEKLEGLLAQGENRLVEFLREETNRSESALRRALQEPQLATDVHQLLIACGHDTHLRDRVLPFADLIREDSFQMPVIIHPGSIYITEGTGRRSTGTHYTPRGLTEPIVQHTMEPLVYQGPAEGWPKEQWQLKPPKEILSLRICDMAMGSGAFLVQACRYLAERLVEAWESAEKSLPGAFIVTPEGDISTGAASERLLPKDSSERLAIARRFVADRCLFGVDINPMAVEMAKLSLWLVTMQRDRPFTFLDHALKCGDSLLGICRFKQLETFSLDDAQATQVLILSNYEELIRTAIAKRRELESLPSNDAAQIAVKEALNAEAEELLSQLKLASDLLIAATLTQGNEQEKEAARVSAHLKVTEHIPKPLEEFRQFAGDQLSGRHTFHWPLEFPEVFECGGFDAFVGNPPFMGGSKITGTLTTAYRNYLIHHLAGERRGYADLCAYFVLRAWKLTQPEAVMGFIATNTIAQGDTREVALDNITATDARIIQAVPSQKWPGSANLEIAQLWLKRGRWRGPCILDGASVKAIAPSLTLPGQVQGNPFRLAANANLSFEGSKLIGMGFILQPDEATELIKRNARNKDVLWPYLNGEDLNVHPDQLPSRWVINFFDWSEQEAQNYPECFRIVLEKVRPERQRKKTGGAYVLRKPLPQRYWQYAEKRPALYSTIRLLERVLVVARVSAHHFFDFSPVDRVFSDRLAVVALSTFDKLAILSSSIHDLWAHRPGSTTHETRNTYFPSDAFETFAFPAGISDLDMIGRNFRQHRRQLMLERQEGLTKTYNRFHDAGEKSAAIAQLRTLHLEMDQAVAAAYGWADLDLGHDFHETKQGVRYTLSEPARRIVLDRLLALNHQRYEEEVKAGLHDKKGKPTGAGGKRRRKSKDPSASPMTALLE